MIRRRWTKTFAIPDNYLLGGHTVQATGIGYDGSYQAVNAGIALVSKGAHSLAFTGFPVADTVGSAAMLLAFGQLLLLFASRRRRRNAAESV